MQDLMILCEVSALSNTYLGDNSLNTYYQQLKDDFQTSTIDWAGRLSYLAIMTELSNKGYWKFYLTQCVFFQNKFIRSNLSDNNMVYSCETTSYE